MNLLAKIKERLIPPEAIPTNGRPRRKIDPLTFHLEALAENADPGRPVPSSGIASALTWALRTAAQPILNHIFARQFQFNQHVHDSYAQMSAEIMKLRQQIVALEKARAPQKKPSKPNPR